MKKRWLLNAALLAVVVALGVFAYLKPRSDEPASHPLSTVQADQIRQIRIERGSRPAIVVDKRKGLWVMTAPLVGRADSFQVERVLAILGARSAQRLAATELGRFDLDQPQARLTIGEQDFSFGTVSALTREQYVLTGGAIYTVEPRYGAALPADATQLISKQLFASSEAPVRFEFKDFSVTRSGGKWRVTPEGAELSQDDLNRWADAWGQAQALRLEPYANSKPIGNIKVELTDSKMLTLAILRREPELVLMRPDENLQYHFSSETARRLLTPPGPKNQ